MANDDKNGDRPPQRALSGAERQLLHGALLGAFSDAAAFERMLSFRLNVQMDHIVPTNATLSSAVFEVIQWWEDRGRLEELMKAAAAEVPGNTALQAAVRRLLEEPEPAASDNASSPRAAAEPRSSSIAWSRGRSVQWG